MAEKERLPRDIRTKRRGLYFDVMGARIQTAIREKISDRLDKQVAETLTRVSALIPDTKVAIGTLAAIATMKTPDDLSPATAEIYQLCRHLQSLTDEVAELQQVGRNLFTDELYRLGLDEIRRFGL